MEPETVTRRATTQIDNETNEDETNDGKHSDGREPKLAFTEGAGSQKVDRKDNDTRNCNPHRIDLAIPVYVHECD